MQDSTPLATGFGRRGKGWPRAAVLLGIAMATAVVQSSVLVGLPFLVLGLVLGMRRPGVFLAAVLALVLVAGDGARDGLWYVERGWGFLIGGWFLALTIRDPEAPFSKRALGAVGGAALAALVFFGIRSGSWGAVDWAIERRVGGGIATAMEALRLLRGDGSVPPALVTALYDTVQTQVKVFPALVGISSMAALGVAWWLYVRLTTGSDQGLGPLRDFRFNDHLVWVFIAGLVLILPRWEDVVARVGANAVVFMGALYAVRGAAVILFLSGGLSFLGYVMLGFGLVFLPPLVLTGAMVIGLGDTWLDVRRRVGSTAA